MWMPTVFFVGMLGFGALILFSKLYKFKGTKLKKRISYAMALTLFFTLFFLWQTQGNIHTIYKGLIVGIFLCAPLCIYTKRWIDKKIEGNKILYKKRNILINTFWAVLLGVFIEEFMPQGYGKTIFESIWPIFGLCLAAFISQVYLFYYVVKLERKIGAPILEDSNS